MAGSRILSTNNEIKDIIKVIRPLENRGILLKGTTEKVINQKWRFLGALMRIGLPLIKNVLKPLAKSVLISLELKAASATHEAIQKKTYRSGKTVLIISNKEMEDIVKIDKSLEEPD